MRMEGRTGDGLRTGRRVLSWKEREDFLISPVQQGFALTLAAEGVPVIGIFAREEEDEGKCRPFPDDIRAVFPYTKSRQG